MPDPYERHARSSENDWGGNPSRSQSRRAAADQELVPAKRPPGKKDPSLCKALHWKGGHTPVLRIRDFGWRIKYGCGWGTSYLDKGDAVWHCVHVEVCSGCGKSLRTEIGSRECPEFHEITDAEILAVQADYARRAELIARSRRRLARPAVTGPQGYRKPKEDRG